LKSKYIENIDTKYMQREPTLIKKKEERQQQNIDLEQRLQNQLIVDI